MTRKRPSATVTWTPLGGSARRCTILDHCEIGRDPANRIILDRPGVSRRHALLVISAIGLELRVVSRTQSVRVNERAEVPPGGRSRLAAGDVVWFDDAHLTVLDVTGVDTPSELLCVNPACRRAVPHDATDCPWCGVSLAFAQTLPDASR